MKKLLKLMLFSLLVCYALILSVSAEIQTGKCGDNLTYTLDTNTGMLEISGYGEMWERAFTNNASIKTVIINDGITGIGKEAFAHCISLAFVTISDSVTNIGELAFSDCISLSSIIILDNVKNIGKKAFNGCLSLSQIIVDDANPYYSSDKYGVLFNKDQTELICCPGAMVSYTIPSSVKKICKDSFSFCQALESVTISDGVEVIEDKAFFNCYQLTSVNIPDSVEYIGVYAFGDCQALKSSITLRGVVRIADYAFFGCRSLKSVTFPDKDFSIGNEAFSMCTSLADVTIPSSAIYIGERAFSICPAKIIVDDANPYYSSDEYGVLFNKDKTILIHCPNSVTSYNIPNGVIKIANYAFFSNDSLKSVTIPGSVASIDGYTFTHCKSLDSVIILSRVAKISYYAFYNCSNLVIRAYKDSTAEQYAKVQNFKFSEITTIITMTIGNNKATVNGEAVINDVPPIIKNSRTMLPVRFVAENLGATVAWNEATSTAIIVGNDVTIMITIGKNAAYINGKEVSLDSPAFIENNRTYMPVRFVSETLGATVAWNGTTSTATITK